MTFICTSIVSIPNPAYGNDNAAIIKSVNFTKTYTSPEVASDLYITITGERLQNANVQILNDEGKLQTIKPSSPGQFVAQYTVPAIGSGERLFIDGVPYDAGEHVMPRITGYTPASGQIKSGEEVELQGSLFDNISSGVIKGYFVQAGSRDYIQPSQVTSNTVIKKNVGNSPGPRTVVFLKEDTVNGVEKTIEHRYVNLFSVYGELNVSDDISMYPTQGPVDSLLTLKAKELMNADSMSVFFLKALDGSDPYTVDNMGYNATYKQNAEDDLDVFTVRVPSKLEPGPYYVVLTNKVEPGQDPRHYVVNTKTFSNNRYIVIDDNDMPVIEGITENFGPASGGKPATVQGRYLGSISPNIYTGGTLVNQEIINENTLKIEYNGGTYKSLGDGVEVEQITREIYILIGNRANFTDGSTFSATGLDFLKITTPATTDLVNPVKDVDAIITTTINYKEDGETKSISVTEQAKLPKAYTYQPLTYTPQITTIIPDKIQVNDDSETVLDLLIGITGENFLVYRYTDDDGQVITKYPMVNLADQIIINKTAGKINQVAVDPKDIDVRVYDSKGNLVDGTPGNELGTKVLVTVPSGKKVNENLINNRTFLRITNPIKNENISDMGSSGEGAIQFIRTELVPIIQSVAPDVVTVDGGEEVVITGSNFRDGVKVFIDGIEVAGVQRGGTGERLTFKAPPGREGETQLQVMNPEGGIATWDFIYVRTFTDPKIFDFSPKRGNTGTLVVIRGENFLKTDPTVTNSSSPQEMTKLIGTRVLLDNQDINSYNRDSKGHIYLEDYTSPADDDQRILQVVGDKVQVAPYYYSVVLADLGASNEKFYMLDVDPQGNVYLTDGIDNRYKLEVENGHKKANKQGAGSYDITVSNTGMTIIDGNGVGNHIQLKMQTAYEVKDNKIVGNRVRVVDEKEIRFTVPILPADGFYDLTVINPDTKRDSKTGELGFYYYVQPDSNPKIHYVEPPQGSTAGGYTVQIKGSGFHVSDTNKPRVSMNGYDINPTHVQVENAETITVMVPPYPGDLAKDKGVRRIAVPVVVVNPDGASDSLEDGFTYVVPTSNPRIDGVVPVQGSAAGREVVEITGDDFRFFEPFDDLNRDGVRDDDEDYDDLNDNREHDDFRSADRSGVKPLTALYEEYHQRITQYLEKEDNPPIDLYEEYGKLLEKDAPVNEREEWIYENIIYPILPKVYFGTEPAKILEFDSGYLKVLSPVAKAGPVDVYVVNNDTGTSNKVTYTYESSNPLIHQIVPNEGRRQGREIREIYGSGFEVSDIQVYQNHDSWVDKEMTLVRFGNITNRDIPRDQVEQGSGRIDGSRTTVNLAGNLRVEYNGADKDNKKVTISVKEDNITYSRVFEKYDDQVKFIPMSLLLDGEGNSYLGYEMIKLEVEDRRLFVDRGFSPKVVFTSANLLRVDTPSYHTVGLVDVIVFNPDGGKAVGKYLYRNPNSNPKIINITKDSRNPVEEDMLGYGEVKIQRISYKGGNIISIIGEDFRENAKIQISNILTIDPADITYMLPNKLTFTMPPVPESEVGQLHRLIVINEDGGTGGSDEAEPTPIYLMFIKGETEPAIDLITPNKGPATGGTRVKIEGRDFRPGLSVFFGENMIPDGDVDYVDYKTVYVTAPPGTPGTVDVRIENPDGELSDPHGTYTYISSPTISALVDAADPAESRRVDTVSVEGGQEIKLKGSGYMEGAKVYFAPKVKEAEENQQGNLIYINGQKHILEEGIEGTEFKFIDEETVTIKTPAVKLESRGVIIVNPDDGASNIYDDIVFNLPELEPPQNIRADLVYDRYIRITWDPVPGATEYEIFVVTDDSQREFVASTELTNFIYQNLKPRTEYVFIVKAVGNFGSSRPSLQTDPVKTVRIVGPPDDDGQLTENTTMTRTGDVANVTLGLRDFDKGETVIDLTKGNLAGAKEVVISIPVEVITSRWAKHIVVNGADYSLRFHPSVFAINRLTSNDRRDDAGVRFRIAPETGNINLAGGNNLSQTYILEGQIYVGQDVTSIDYLNMAHAGNQMVLTLDCDMAKAEMRRLESFQLQRFNVSQQRWEAVNQVTKTGLTAVNSSINRLGRYMIIGSRR